MHCRVFNSIPGLHRMSGAPPPPIVTTKIISRHCHTSLVRKTWPGLRNTALEGSPHCHKSLFWIIKHESRRLGVSPPSSWIDYHRPVFKGSQSNNLILPSLHVVAQCQEHLTLWDSLLTQFKEIKIPVQFSSTNVSLSSWWAWFCVGL